MIKNRGNNAVKNGSPEHPDSDRMMPRYPLFHNAARTFFVRWMIACVLLYMLTVPFSRPLLPDPGHWTAPLFETLARWTGDHLLHIRRPYVAALLSDATGLYIHLLHLALLSGLLSLCWTAVDRKAGREARYHRLFHTACRYYLAVQLLSYGLNKVFKWQFFLPEPNTLYTTVGQLPRDLLYWTAMGSSWSYSVFAGGLEVVAGLLLFFRRTTLLGALLSTGVMANVVMINFSYDISVKVYSLFLLLLSLVLVSAGRRRLYPLIGRPWVPQGKPAPRSGRWYGLVKLLTVAYIVADATFVYFREWNFNDDTARRPFLHGAYEVEAFTRNGALLPPLLTDSFRWRRLFVHRRGYLIIQSMQETMTDYPLAYDTVRHQLHAEGPDGTAAVLDYRLTADSGLYLSGYWQGDSIGATLRKVKLQELPLLQPGFHWTMDW